MLKAALFTILSAASVLVLAGCEGHQVKVDRLQKEYDRLAAQFQSDCSAEYYKVPPTLSPKCQSEERSDGQCLEAPSKGTRREVNSLKEKSMNNKIVLAAIAVAASTLAYAQFGSGIVFDPTQSGHAIQQIAQGNQLYTTTVQMTRNVIAAYNLAQRMASLPRELYTSYSNQGRQEWIVLTRPANTYGNSVAWINAATSGYGASTANQVSSIPMNRTDRRLLLDEYPRTTGDCCPRGNGRFVRCHKRKQFTDRGDNSREFRTTRS